MQKGLPAARWRSCHRSAHEQLCTVHSAAAQRQKILVIIHLHNFILISSTVYNNLNLFSQFLVFDLWRCAWAKLPRFPPHCPGQEQGRGWTVRPASGWCHIFEWRRDPAGAMPIEPLIGTWRTAGKGEGSWVADGREQQPLGAKAIDDWLMQNWAALKWQS